MTTLRVLEVRWEDAVSHDAWAGKAETAAFVGQPCLSVSVGLEISNDDKAIVLAASANVNEERGGVWRIPRGMVRKVRVLGRVEIPEEKAVA